MSAVGLTMVKDPPQFFMAFPDDPAGVANQRKLDETDEVLFIGSVGYVCINSVCVFVSFPKRKQWNCISTFCALL